MGSYLGFGEFIKNNLPQMTFKSLCRKGKKGRGGEKMG
jgi:hypothetical protein